MILWAAVQPTESAFFANSQSTTSPCEPNDTIWCTGIPQLWGHIRAALLHLRRIFWFWHVSDAPVAGCNAADSSLGLAKSRAHTPKCALPPAAAWITHVFLEQSSHAERQTVHLRSHANTSATWAACSEVMSCAYMSLDFSQR